MNVDEYSVLYQLYYYELRRHWAIIGRVECQ